MTIRKCPFCGIGLKVMELTHEDVHVIRHVDPEKAYYLHCPMEETYFHSKEIAVNAANMRNGRFDSQN